MTRKFLLVCALTLPLFLFAVVAQSVAFHDASRQVSQRMAQQDAWIEKNKKLLAGVTVLEAPGRIETLADSLGLASVGASGTLKIRFGAQGGTP
ncbi:MAG: hypothetical protein WCG80_07685 [Spirochaetales bacterium]